MSEAKRKPGRPVKNKAPAPIPDTAEKAIKSLVKTRSKPERDTLRKRAKEDSAS